MVTHKSCEYCNGGSGGSRNSGGDCGERNCHLDLDLHLHLYINTHINMQFITPVTPSLNLTLGPYFHISMRETS